MSGLCYDFFMTEHSVLYRKYRPQTFTDVVGQDHIIQSLVTAVEKGTVAHSYIFSGPRGTGKTTVARILARAVNCTGAGKKKPCLKCDVCTQFQAGTSLDLIEIDGASNNGVDEIRELREAVRFHPQTAQRKVYIIDEVHMLSKGAFNALLKTIEEPPEYVMFILATTDLDKVPDTIRSRCEEFQFRRLPATVIQKRLAEIAALEGADISKDALRILSLLAEGSERDAESALGQVLASHTGVIPATAVTTLFGLPQTSTIAKLLQSVIRGTLKDSLAIVSREVAGNTDPQHLTKLLIEDLKHTLFLAVDSEYTGTLSSEMSNEHIQFIKQEGSAAGVDELRRILVLLLEAFHSQLNGAIAELPLELALVEIHTKRPEKK